MRFGFGFPLPNLCHIWKRDGGVLKNIFVIISESLFKALQIFSIIPAPPSITYITPYTEAAIGENVTIRCDVQGSPVPKVSWMTSEGRILDKEVGLRDVSTLDDGTRRVRLKEQQEDNSLLITDVHVGDSGLYTCMATNSFGHIRREANLTVRKGIRRDLSLVYWGLRYNNIRKNYIGY